MHERLGPGGRRRRLQIDQFTDPIVINGGAFAVARQQRRCHAGNAGQENLIERLFQHVQASDTDNRINMAADDDFEDDRRPLGNQHFVAEVLGPGLEIGDGARPALAAIQTQFVIIGGAPLGVLEAMRQQQQTPFEIDGLDLFSPELIGDTYHCEAEVLLAQLHAAQQVFAFFLQLCLGKRPAAIEGLTEASRFGPDAIAQRARLRHDFEMSGAGSFVFLFGLKLGSGSHVPFLSEFTSSGKIIGKDSPKASSPKQESRPKNWPACSFRRTAALPYSCVPGADANLRRARPSAATLKMTGYSFSKYHSLAK